MKLTRAQLKHLEQFKENAPVKRSRGHRIKNDGQKGGGDPLFLAACLAHGLPAPEAEYAFALEIGRKWEADYLFDGWLCVEIEGSPWKGKPCPLCGQRSGGRHNHGQGYLDDIEKYNAMVILGYSLIRVTHDMIVSGEAFAVIKRALYAQGESS